VLGVLFLEDGYLFIHNLCCYFCRSSLGWQSCSLHPYDILSVLMQMTVIFVFVNAVATRERFYLSPIRSGSLNVDLHSIDKRRQQLLNFDQATSYSKHKDSLQRELETFLSRLPGRVSLATATPPRSMSFSYL